MIFALLFLFCDLLLSLFVAGAMIWILVIYLFKVGSAAMARVSSVKSSVTEIVPADREGV